MPSMIIVRGIPGSGKSTVAEALAIYWENSIICEADDYFYNEAGDYNYNPSLITEAHEWCYNKAYESCLKRKNIIISNTSVLEKHVNKYIDLANQHGYEIQIITCQSTFKNIHAVPEEDLNKFNRRMCYKAFNLGC